MADFPALEVVVMLDGPGLEEGARFPITEFPFRIGRAPWSMTSWRPGQAPLKGLRCPSNGVARNHAEVVFEYGRWWVRDLGSTNGTVVRGERINDAELQHGDCFGLGEGVLFRLLLRPPEEPAPALAAAIQADPDDAGRWSVYADRLQERGDPLGLRIANPRAEEHLRWLEPLATCASEGDLDVTWAHGLPARVVLRHLGGRRARLTWEKRLALLAGAPGFRFVRHLELDLRSFGVEADVAGHSARALELLGVEALPALERLVLGPMTARLTGPERGGLTRALEARRARWPRFTTGVDELHQPWGAARLVTPEGLALPVDPRGQALGDRASPLSLAFSGDRWALTSEAGDVRVNGVGTRWATLRGGDLIDGGPGRAFRFEA